MFDVAHILESGGLLAIAAIVFAESGLMVGFFLPGDTLLMTAGIFAAQGKLSIALTIAVIALAAILGDNTGYAIGRALGPKLFRKKDGIIFRQEYVKKAEKFYARFGSKTMLFAHFVPIVRSFAPMIAGVGKMPRSSFIIYDAIGDIVWAASVTLVGYWFGSKIPNIEAYIIPAIGVATLFTFGPMIYHLFADKKTRTRLFAALRGKRKPTNIEE